MYGHNRAPQPSQPSRGNRRVRVVTVSALAAGVALAGAIAAGELFGGDDSTPTAAPRPTASAQPSTPVETVTVTASPSATESTTPNATPSASATETASATPTPDRMLTVRQAAAAILTEQGCMGGSWSNDGPVKHNGHMATRLEFPITAYANPASTVTTPGVKTSWQIVFKGYDPATGKFTGKDIADTIPQDRSAVNGMTDVYLPTSISAGSNFVATVRSRATTAEGTTQDTYVCTEASIERGGPNGWKVADVPYPADQAPLFMTDELPARVG